MRFKIANVIAGFLLAVVSSVGIAGECVDPYLDKAISTILDSAKKLNIGSARDAKDLVEFANLPLIQASHSDIARKIDRLAEVKDLVGPSAKILRNEAGKVMVSRNLVNGEKLLRGKEGNAGLIPKEIGDMLSGKSYNNFDEFRRDFWVAVSKSKYINQFKPSNQSLMKDGKAPFALEEQWVGERGKYELHHIEPIHRGGSVYDLSNLMIVTPRFHKEVLDRSFHYGD